MYHKMGIPLPLHIVAPTSGQGMSRGLSKKTPATGYPESGLEPKVVWARVGMMGKLNPISLTSELRCTTQGMQMGLSEGRFSKIKCNFH